MARSSIIMFSSDIETLDHIYPSQEAGTTLEDKQSQVTNCLPAKLKLDYPELTSDGFFRFGPEEYIDDINKIYQLIFGNDCYSSSKMRA